MRQGLAALALAAAVAAGCGHYGPPVRPAPSEPAQPAASDPAQPDADDPPQEAQP